MTDSILDSVKDGCDGIPPDDSSFDAQLIIFINDALSELETLGVKHSTPFFVSDNTTTWTDWNSGATIENSANLPYVLAEAKNFVIASVRLAFDPPANNVSVTLLQDRIKKLGYRIRDRAELKGDS